MRKLNSVIVMATLSLLLPVLAKAQAPVIVDNGTGISRVTKSASRPIGVTAPIPAALRNARRFFLSNAGADAGLFPHPFAGTQDRAYAYLLTALGAQKRFDMVASPAEADVVAELRLNAPMGSIGGDKTKGTEDPLPTFTLVLYDRPTHYILWSISQTVDQAFHQKTHDKNFDEALDLLLQQLLLVTGK